MSHQYSKARDERQSPEAWLMQSISGFMVTQYLHVAAKLELADILKDGPLTAGQLAAACGADARALYRLMRALASMGVFAEIDGERFVMTDLAEPLRKDVPFSLHAIAKLYGEPWFFQAYGALDHSVMTGQTAFEHLFGVGCYQYFASHPDAAQSFDDAMDGFTTSHAKWLVQEYDFGRFSKIMDVGGNRGALLLAVLRAFPHTRGVLFDRDHVLLAAQKRFAQLEADVQSRFELAMGDFMTELPSGCDAYILRNVLQDWPDEQAHKLLSNCRRATSPQGTLLVIGRVIEPGNDPYPGKFTDLTMMVLTSGRERTLDEHRDLFLRAGFSLRNVVRTRALVSILEATPIP